VQRAYGWTRGIGSESGKNNLRSRLNNLECTDVILSVDRRASRAVHAASSDHGNLVFLIGQVNRCKSARIEDHGIGIEKYSANVGIGGSLKCGACVVRENAA